MTIRAQNRTPAALAARRPQRPLVYTQAQQRERRQAGHVVALGGNWSLTADVSAICCPLAEGVSVTTNPAGHWRQVDAVADAVHALASEAVALLARADAERRCRHLGVDDRGRSIRALVDMTPRPPAPEITDEALAAGTWAETLAELAAPFSADLSALLGNALTDVVSNRLVAALRDVDLAALTLQRRLAQATATKPAEAAPDPTDLVRAELESLGVTL